MKNVYILPALFFSSCAAPSHYPLDYIGAISEPTSHVDVFVSEKSIKKSYDVVGRSATFYNSAWGNSGEKVQQRAVETARKKGADAILIREVYIDRGFFTDGIARRDSVGTGTFTISRSGEQSQYVHNLEILYLRYVR